MSAIVAMVSELEQRGDAYGRELAAALVLAGERSGGDGGLMRQMAAIAVREIVSAVRWLKESGLPDALVADYERACRAGFRAEFQASLRAIPDEMGRQAA